MHAWNVVVTAHTHGYKNAIHVLEKFGWIDRTEFFNVLTMAVADTRAFLEGLRDQIEAEPAVLQSIAHVVPVTTTFVFQTPDEFETKAREAVLAWVPALSGSHFHVRMHRRGFKGRLSSQAEEQFLDHCVMERLAADGATAQIDFKDPDFVIAVETVGQQAGLSLWTREDLRRYEFLQLN